MQNKPFVNFSNDIVLIKRENLFKPVTITAKCAGHRDVAITFSPIQVHQLQGVPVHRTIEFADENDGKTPSD